LELLDLVALALNLALLTRNLTLLLPCCAFLVLQRVTDYVASARTQRAANRRARTRSAHRGADYRTRAGTQHSTTQRPFFPSR
jgi:hypothetical protein